MDDYDDARPIASAARYTALKNWTPISVIAAESQSKSRTKIMSDTKLTREWVEEELISAEKYGLHRQAALCRHYLATEQQALGPIERNDDYEREYITLPGGWEVHTKGLGSSFRIANTKNGERLNIPDSPYLQETLEQMARDIHAALTQKEPQT